MACDIAILYYATGLPSIPLKRNFDISSSYIYSNIRIKTSRYSLVPRSNYLMALISKVSLCRFSNPALAPFSSSSCNMLFFCYPVSVEFIQMTIAGISPFSSGWSISALYSINFWITEMRYSTECSPVAAQAWSKGDLRSLFTWFTLAPSLKSRSRTLVSYRLISIIKSQAAYNLSY